MHITQSDNDKFKYPAEVYLSYTSINTNMTQLEVSFPPRYKWVVIEDTYTSSTHFNYHR